MNGTAHEYFYSNGRLAFERIGSRKLFYIYDGYGTLCAIYHNNGSDTTRYHVATTVRGDVEALYNDEGTLVARYVYDSWGKVLGVYDSTGAKNTSEAFIGNINPIRYRGYYYDVETGFYYLGSRYYDPEVGRFISADTTDVLTLDIGSVYQKNLYVYCCNNPVNYNDNLGESVVVACTIVNVGLNVVFSAMAAQLTGEKYTILDGIVTASTTLMGAGGLKGIIIGAVAGGLYSGYKSYVDNENFEKAILNTVVTAGCSIVSIGTLMDIAMPNAVGIELIAKTASSVPYAIESNLVSAVITKAVNQKEAIKKSINKIYGKKENINAVNRREQYIKTKNGRLMR